MGRREVEFEVERRRDDQTPVRETELVKNDAQDQEKSGSEGDGTGRKKKKRSDDSWSGWMEDPRTMNNMRYFVVAQTFVLVLSYGLPQIMRFWAIIKNLF